MTAESLSQSLEGFRVKLETRLGTGQPRLSLSETPGSAGESDPGRHGRTLSEQTLRVPGPGPPATDHMMAPERHGADPGPGTIIPGGTDSIERRPA